ncbi:MAG: hypothetical protein IJ251_08955 [Oscillospiraceae bacterium]|nr:hypothetical protein [Oscillospiraceae bacterium]
MAANTQSFTSVYQEKKIAGYEGWFKESSFSKPVNVYLTITVAHIFGEAYIMEQEGTQENDPIYQRFICPLEEITKVYVNDGVKSTPLFIQCDTDVKGIVHRKRIIIPCLEHPQDIVNEIEKVRAAHTAKIEQALEAERKRKTAAAVANAEKKKAQKSAPAEKAAEKPVEAPEVKEEITAAQVSAPKAEEPSVIPSLPKLDPVIEAAVQARMSGDAAEPVKDIRTVLDEDLEKDLKALEKISAGIPDGKSDDIEEIRASKKKPPKVKPAEADDVPEIEQTEKRPKLRKAKSDIPDEVEELTHEEMMIASQSINDIPAPAEVINEVEEISGDADALPELAQRPDELAEIELPETTEEISPAYEQPVSYDIPDISEPVFTVPEPAPVQPEPEETAAEPAAVETAPEPAPVRKSVTPAVHTGGLASFEEAVVALNERRMKGEITEEEYAAQRRQLVAGL